MTDQLSLGTEYISPTELWVRVDAYEAEAHEVGAGVALDEKLRIWVKGKEERFQLSEPYDVTLRPVHLVPARRVGVETLAPQDRRGHICLAVPHQTDG